MLHLEGASRNQTLLLFPRVEDYIPEDHPVRVIDAFVDSLNLVEMGFKKAETVGTGRRNYPPGDLLKLWTCTYLNQTSRTRRLEKECHRTLEVAVPSNRAVNHQGSGNYAQKSDFTMRTINVLGVNRDAGQIPLA